jgi:hypothetical protein
MSAWPAKLLIFVHLETGETLKVHTNPAICMGEVKPLKVSVFDKNWKVVHLPLGPSVDGSPLLLRKPGAVVDGAFVRE